LDFSSLGFLLKKKEKTRKISMRKTEIYFFFLSHFFFIFYAIFLITGGIIRERKVEKKGSF
jgi:hypothetical protein